MSTVEVVLTWVFYIVGSLLLVLLGCWIGARLIANAFEKLKDNGVVDVVKMQKENAALKKKLTSAEFDLDIYERRWEDEKHRASELAKVNGKLVRKLTAIQDMYEDLAVSNKRLRSVVHKENIMQTVTGFGDTEEAKDDD